MRPSTSQENIKEVDEKVLEIVPDIKELSYSDSDIRELTDTDDDKSTVKADSEMDINDLIDGSDSETEIKNYYPNMVRVAGKKVLLLMTKTSNNLYKLVVSAYQPNKKKQDKIIKELEKDIFCDQGEIELNFKKEKVISTGFEGCDEVQINFEIVGENDDKEASAVEPSTTMAMKEDFGNVYYHPSPHDLQMLRAWCPHPFVDVEGGKMFTANTQGEWKKCLQLKEILTKLDNNKGKAWEKLFEELAKEPKLAEDWMSGLSKPPFTPTPHTFRFGSKKNFKKIRDFLKVIKNGKITKNKKKIAWKKILNRK